MIKGPLTALNPQERRVDGSWAGGRQSDIWPQSAPGLALMSELPVTQPECGSEVVS